MDVSGFFDINILVNLYEVMSVIEKASYGLLRLFGVTFVCFGLFAISVEADERSHSRIFKRGYGWGLTMIFVGFIFAVIDWFVRMMSYTAVGESDPMQILSRSTDSIAQMDTLQVFYIFLAAYLSLLGFFFLIGGLLMAIRASHRQEKGAGAVVKFFVSGLLLFYFASYMESNLLT